MDTIVSAPPIHHVLLCTDGSPAMDVANRTARLLARTCGASLHLVHVVQSHSPACEALREEIQEQAVELGALCDVLELGPDDGYRVAAPIARHREGRADALLCVSSRGRHSLTRSILGSVTDELVRHGDTPVLVVGPEAVVPDRFARVVACTDGGELSLAVMPAAAGLARDLGVPLWIVQVREPGELPAGDLVEAAAVEAIARSLDLEGVDVEWEVLHGHHPARAVLDFAGDDPQTILALATHARGGLREVALGSVAQGVLRRARGPVLLLRPRAVESP